jgi:hypothetical protein
MTDCSAFTRRWYQFTFGQLLALLAVGGVILACRRIDSSAMVPYRTGRAVDLAILGRGYFQLLDPVTGEFRYTRDGHFSLDNNGDLVLFRQHDRFFLEPQITLPPDWTDIAITRDGLIAVQQAGAVSRTRIGRIQLACFINEEGLKEAEQDIYEETEASGAASLQSPGASEAGVVLQGWLNGAPHWKAALLDGRVQVFLLGAIVVTLGWLALELRRQQRALAAVLARMTDSQISQHHTRENLGQRSG